MKIVILVMLMMAIATLASLGGPGMLSIARVVSMGKKSHR
jgi:hypothetical protein